MIKKVILNIGFGKTEYNKSKFEYILNNIIQISGQKCIITTAKKSISEFKIKKKDYLGCKVTLRGSQMYNFLKKLLFVVLPNIKDFYGLNNTSFDGKGNYNFGIKEQSIFPEITYVDSKFITGLNISIITNSDNDKDALFLLSKFAFPFKNIFLLLKKQGD